MTARVIPLPYETAREAALERENAILRYRLAEYQAFGRSAEPSAFFHEQVELPPPLPRQLAIPLLASVKVAHERDRWRIIGIAHNKRDQSYDYGLYVSDLQLYEARDSINLLSKLLSLAFGEFARAIDKLEQQG